MVSILLALLACACIKRTGPGPSGPDQKASGTSAALEARNARIASVPRTDLVGAPGNAAFKLQGEDAKKVEITTVPAPGMPFAEAIAGAITQIDPSALTLGANMFGWSEFMSLSDAPDAKEQNEKYGTYTDFFLASMKDLEAKHGRRLLHALDVHWYPEAKGSKRITDKDISPKTVAARLQAPRSLWDPSYTEKSWIASQWGKPIRLIPWLLERIDERYPGTKLAITEYNYGVGDHISGGLAQADVLGILGREGVYLANYWGDGAGNIPLPPYIKAAFKLYRNYDGKHGAYADTAVTATPADLGKASVYAATDSKRPGTLTVIVINKDQQATYSSKLDIRGGGYGKAQVYALDSGKAEVRSMSTVDIKNDRLEYRLPPLSATLFVCQR